MTQQEAQNLLKQMSQAKNKDELQQLISRNVGCCDSVFFTELETLAARYRAQNDESSARKLKDLGDTLARLRFMI
jgi:hypothetical protein